MPITATYTPAQSRLSILGTPAAEGIIVSRNAAGTLLVNAGAVPISGGTATVANTMLVEAIGDDGADTITLDETNGALPAAEFHGGAGNDSLSGGSAGDTLAGEADDDTLVGKGGTDWLDGGEGSDLYIMLSAADHPAAEIVDSGSAGTDELRFTTANAETLTLYAGDTGLEKIVIGTGTGVTADSTATTAINVNAMALGYGVSIIGNAGANVLFGGAGNDTLFGGGGNDVLDGGTGGDTMAGGAGDDSYLVDSVSDVIVEGFGGGLDTVFTRVSYTLSDDVERLGVNGFSTTYAINLTGNAHANELRGNDGANVIDGRTGADLMTASAATTSTSSTMPAT